MPFWSFQVSWKAWPKRKRSMSIWGISLGNSRSRDEEYSKDEKQEGHLSRRILEDPRADLETPDLKTKKKNKNGRNG